MGRENEYVKWQQKKLRPKHSNTTVRPDGTVVGHDYNPLGQLRKDGTVVGPDGRVIGKRSTDGSIHGTELVPFIHQIERSGSGKLAYDLEKSEEAVSYQRKNCCSRGHSFAERIADLQYEMERLRDEQTGHPGADEVKTAAQKRCIEFLKLGVNYEEKSNDKFGDDSFHVYSAVYNTIEKMEGPALSDYRKAAEELDAKVRQKQALCEQGTDDLAELYREAVDAQPRAWKQMNALAHVGGTRQERPRLKKMRCAL